MRLILKIALGNILRHKGKSLVVGTIIFIGSLIMIIGNAVVSGMDRGLQSNIVDRFTGHIIIVSTNQEDNNVFLTLEGRPIEPIAEYKNIKKILQSEPYIENFLPVGINTIMVMSETCEPWRGIVIGVEFDKYQKMFHSNVIVVEGRLITNRERGFLITEYSRSQIYDLNRYWIKPAELNISNNINSNKLMPMHIRTNLVIMGGGEGNYTSDANVPIKGIIKYSYLNNLWQRFNIIDIETFREAFNYFSTDIEETKIPREKSDLIKKALENSDELFSSEEIIENAPVLSEKIDFKRIVKESKEKLEKAREKAKIADVEAGMYNLVLIKIIKNEDLNQSIKKLNKILKENHLDARAISWREAIGTIAQFATLIRGALTLFVLFLFFVAIIIIMNTLSMSAVERVPEIGMMRAVGARKSFISRMFLAETSMLSFVFGLGGIIFGTFGTFTLSLLNIKTGNDMLQLLFGGDVFCPSVELKNLLEGIFQLIVVTLLAVIYPLKIAKKISPLDAISRE